MNIVQNAVGALFDGETDDVGDAIGSLVRSGVLPGSLAIITRSDHRARTLCESYHVRAIDAFEKPRNAIADFISLRDEQKAVKTRDLFDVLRDHGIDSDRAAHFSSAIGDGVLLIIAGADVTAERVSVLIAAHADLGLANRGGIERIIPLRAELVDVQKSVVVTNEVSVSTEIVHETKSFDVQVMREEFVIRRTHVQDGGSIETIRIPLRHEEVIVTKQTVITGEVEVHTEQLLSVEHIEEDARHEVLSVIEHPRESMQPIDVFEQPKEFLGEV